MGLHLLCACLLYHTPAQVSQVTTRVALHSFPAAPVQSGHLRDLMYSSVKKQACGPLLLLTPFHKICLI